MTPSSRRNFAAGALVSTNILGATLLFSSELISGRLLTPLFGGSSAVWLTCLAFYQVALFLGYLYAHLLARRLGKWHLLIAVVALAFMPLNIDHALMTDHPHLSLLVTLFESMGVPFLVLSTTAVVTQLYWERSESTLGRDPYVLYATSNAGSLLALLAYPLLIEPFTRLTTQRWVWTAGFAVYVLVLVAGWVLARPQLGPQEARTQDAPRPTLSTQLKWVLLSALPSAMLVAASARISSEVGSFPLIWVLPLGLYILTFIIVFSGRGDWVRSWSRKLLPEVTLVALLLSAIALSSMTLVGIYVFSFFALCLAAHAEMYERRPAPAHLTRYYLLMSLGGGIGGMMATFLPPMLMDGTSEYLWLALALAATFVGLKSSSITEYLRGTSLLRVAPRLTLLLTLGTLLALYGRGNMDGHLESTRNFYGSMRVEQEPRKVARGEGGEVLVRSIMHGQTRHGSEIISPPLGFPPDYFHPDGAIAATYRTFGSAERVAVLGLGAGVVASMVGPQTTLHFLEINPDNEALARKWFTYMDESPAREVKTFVGDGRLLLDSDALNGTDTQRLPYGFIHLDAFSGDGIPAHLLTVEAWQIYLDRLTSDGAILAHISNRYYELLPLIKALARHFGLSAVHNLANLDRAREDSLYGITRCVVLSRDPARLQPLLDAGWVDVMTRPDVPDVPVWTDEHSNMLRALWLSKLSKQFLTAPTPQ